jgi:hypothetical protein
MTATGGADTARDEPGVAAAGIAGADDDLTVE